MIYCDSNQRCEACPLERIPDAEDRVQAGSVVRSVVRVLAKENVDRMRMGTLRVMVENAAHNYADEFTGHVIGAAAINLTGECKVK